MKPWWIAIVMLLFSCLIWVACGTNGDDDDDDASAPNDWRDSDSSAHDNCLAFYGYFFACFGLDEQPDAFEYLCSRFEDWEDQYGTDSCTSQALSGLLDCWEGLACGDFPLFDDHGAAAVECLEAYESALETCPGDDDDDNDDNDDNVDEFYSEDFESYTPPNLNGDWTVESDGGTVEVVASKDGQGQTLRIQDGSGENEYALAMYLLDDNSEMNGDRFTHAFDYRGASGLLSYDLLQDDGQDQYPEIEIDLPVDGGEIQVYDPGVGFAACGTVLSPEVWYTIEVVIDPLTSSFSILVDGAATGCTDRSLYFGDAPLAGYRLLGFAGTGQGGQARFDNIRMYR
jgi:hypothetical protein